MVGIHDNEQTAFFKMVFPKFQPLTIINVKINLTLFDAEFHSASYGVLRPEFRVWEVLRFFLLRDIPT